MTEIEKSISDFIHKQDNPYIDHFVKFIPSLTYDENQNEIVYDGKYTIVCDIDKSEIVYHEKTETVYDEKKESLFANNDPQFQEYLQCHNCKGRKELQLVTPNNTRTAIFFLVIIGIIQLQEEIRRSVTTDDLNSFITNLINGIGIILNTEDKNQDDIRKIMIMILSEHHPRWRSYGEKIKDLSETVRKVISAYIKYKLIEMGIIVSNSTYSVVDFYKTEESENLFVISETKSNPTELEPHEYRFLNLVDTLLDTNRYYYSGTQPNKDERGNFLLCHFNSDYKNEKRIEEMWRSANFPSDHSGPNETTGTYLIIYGKEIDTIDKANTVLHLVTSSLLQSRMIKGSTVQKPDEINKLIEKPSGGQKRSSNKTPNTKRIKSNNRKYMSRSGRRVYRTRTNYRKKTVRQRRRR